MPEFYHITPTKNLKRILVEGLLPKFGARCRKTRQLSTMPEDQAVELALRLLRAKKRVPAIFFFATRADADESNWICDEFGENTRLALLAVEIPEGCGILSDVEWERHVLEPIPATHIKVLNRSWGDTF